jgi:pimeloyl-ACP methyl ester carboxylesterase
VPVTVVEVGSALRPKPTILHFHGAQVGTDDILFYRLANGFKAAGKPIRIISAEWEDAEAVLEQLHQTTGQKVAVMGHSAGGHVASLLARRHGDKVSHFVSLDVPGFMPGNVPSLLVAGTASDYANRALEKTVAGDDRTTVVRIPMADLNLRARPPETLPLFEPHQKPALNSSPESARVAADVAGHIHRFLEGAPHDSGLLKKLKAQPAR